MKIFRYLILFSLLFLFNLPVMADVMPYYTGSLSKETIGFLQVPKSFKLYLYPRYDSQIIDTVQWTNTEVKLKNKTIEPSALFAAQIQSKGMAFCMVIDENEDNWYKIIYDKTTNSSGWIKAGSEDDFWGLRDFYSFYGRRYGLYYMKNIDYRNRGIYSGADENSQKLAGFILIKSIILKKVSGNWVLVSVIDLGSQPKIGYIQWRETDGSILLFPKLGAQ